MEAAAAAAVSEAANDVPLTSKLSPFVKPFVPRRFQTEAHPATVDPVLAQQPPAQPEPTQQPTVSGRATQSNYNASYASGGLNPRASGYAGEPRHARHYIPFLSGPYALQDYQTGYGLYPYPVFMFEEMATPGSFVSPGTFVCPRASLKPQRRSPRKSVFPNGNPRNFPTTAITTATATATTTTTTTTNIKSDVRPTVSKARIDSAPSRIVENGGVATINTGLQKLKTVHNRTALAKDKPSETQFVAARSFSGKQQQPKISEGQSDKSTVTTNGDISCLSTAVATTADSHAVVDNPTAVAVKETKDLLPTNVNVNRDSPSCPKSKSFADIIRQQNSSTVDDNVYSLNDRRAVLRRRNSNINESVKTKTNSTPEVDQHLDKRQLDDSKIETRYRSADAGKQKQQLEHNRWTPVLSRSSRRTSENSDSSSVRSQNKNSNRQQRSNKMHQTSKKIPTRPDMLLEDSDSVPAVTGALESPTNVKSEADDDADTWTEVKSNRRWKETKNNRRPITQATKERPGIFSVYSARSAETTSHDQSMCRSVKTHQVSVGETDEVKTAAGPAKLCNASKTSFKHASGNHLEKGLSVNHSEKSKTEVDTHIEKTKAEAEPEKPRISDKVKHADRSKNVESDSTGEPAEVSKVPTAAAAKKKKRKTDGQSKQDFRNKLKTLPSIQGKVLTVTEEFYNQLKGNSEALDQQQCTVASGSRDFKADDFPFLSSDANISTLLNINSDDSWSDIECSLETSTKCGGANKTATAAAANARPKSSGLDEFPALGNFMEPLIASETTSYSSLLKKNFWSLPPRITPADSMTMKGGGGGSPAFWEKLLAESSLDDFQTSTKKESNVIVGNKKATSKESFTNHATISDATESMAMTCKRTEHKPKKPKSASLVQISLINLLKRKEKRSKKIPMRPHLLSSKDAKGIRKVRPFVANILDSTAPLRRRGKEREKPAKKKQSALKRVILKERIERRLVRDSVASEQLEGDVVTPRNALDAKESASTSSALSDVETTVVTAKQKIHSGKFREYCNQMLNPAIDDAVQKLISDLIRFHDRLYQRDPVKAKIRRRMVVGLREVGKHLKLKKIKCLILAPNLERIQSTGGLDDAMYSVIGLAREQNIPFVFALGRRRLGRVCLKKVPVSCVGIFNYEGSEVNFNHLCELAVSARDAYQRTLSQVIEGFAELSTDEQ